MDDYMSKPIDLKILKKKLVVYGPPASVGAAQGAKDMVDEDVLYDLSGIMNIMDNDEVDVLGFLVKFISISSANMDKLKVALESGDFESAKIKAHGIKGSTMQLKANSVSNCALELEAACRAKDAQLATKAFELLSNEYERLRKELEKRIL